jgi:hypothetical protein
LEHVPVGSHPPLALMATGSTGLTATQRLAERRFETTLGTQGSGQSSASMLLARIGTVSKTDFNMDGVTNVSGDGSVLIANLGRSGALFQEGDANNDHRVNVSGDGSKFVAQLGTDILGSGQGLAEYNPATGQVLISTNGAGFIEIGSSLSQLIPGNAVPTNTAGLGASFSDPFTTTTVNYLSFSALGTGGILDDFSIGAILPTGISDPSGFVPGALFRWSVVGGGEFSAGVQIIPEPGSLILASLGAFSLLWKKRRTAKIL